MNNIKVGDLVIVVRPKPCGHIGRRNGLGTIFKVRNIVQGRFKCKQCGYCSFTFGAQTEGFKRFQAVHFSSLKVIPPFPELLTETFEEKIKEKV